MRQFGSEKIRQSPPSSISHDHRVSLCFHFASIFTQLFIGAQSDFQIYEMSKCLLGTSILKVRLCLIHVVYQHLLELMWSTGPPAELCRMKPHDKHPQKRSDSDYFMCSTHTAAHSISLWMTCHSIKDVFSLIIGLHFPVWLQVKNVLEGRGCLLELIRLILCSIDFSEIESDLSHLSQLLPFTFNSTVSVKLLITC